MAGRIRIKSLANFSKQGAVCIRSGLSLNRAFALIARESKDRLLRRTLKEIGADIGAGNTFSEALATRSNRFPPIFVELVKAGERAGRLEQVFSNLADYFDKRLMLRGAVIRASIYPMIQVTMGYAVFCLIMIVFSPDKRAMAERIAFYSASAIAAFIIVRLFFTRSDIGRAVWDRLVLGVPFLRSVVIKLCLARFTRAFAMQMESAIPISEAIERSALVTGNGAVAKNLKRMTEPLLRGERLTEAVSRSRLVTPLIREIVAIAEETGDFTDAFERIADIYEEESMVVLESLPKFIGPVVLILVGLLVLFLFYTVLITHYIKPLFETLGV